MPRLTNSELVAAIRRGMRVWYASNKDAMPASLPELIDEMDARLDPKPPETKPGKIHGSP